jgi:hypothetical protein
MNVVHVNKEPYDVYIGRPSQWGNPYSHKIGTLAQFRVNTVKEAIDAYEKYLLANTKLMESLHELKGKTLGCWCKPGPCHGDIIIKLLKTHGNELF